MKHPNGNCHTCKAPLYRKPSHWNKGLKAYCGNTCRIGTKSTDLSGKRFGKLVVVSLSGKDEWNAANWLCNCDCGNTTITSSQRLSNGTTRSCGCIRSGVGRASPKWKNGKTVARTGYVILRCPDSGKQLGYEHRVVMESILGRKLLPGETVHHKNGVKTDNSPENLELKASNHGPGQSIEDLILWAKEILRRYDN